MTNDPNVNTALLLLKQQLGDTYGRDIKDLQMQSRELTVKVDALTRASIGQQSNSRINSIILIVVLVLTLVNVLAIVGLYARAF
jgi:hypothetical protein